MRIGGDWWNCGRASEAAALTSRQRIKPFARHTRRFSEPDGPDNGSKVTAEIATKAAQQADAVIYAIHYEDSDSPSPGGESALDHLSEPTGGRTFQVSAILPLKAIFDAIREEMRSQYAISYTSTNRAKDGSYRRLTVKTIRFGLKVQARQGYYAPR